MSDEAPPAAETRTRGEPARPELRYDLSLALHTAVATRLDEEMIARARDHLETWLGRGGPSTPLLERWRDLLALPLTELRAFLTDPGEEAAWLRKASPFAGVLAPREREQIVRRVRRSAGAAK